MSHNRVTLKQICKVIAENSDTSRGMCTSHMVWLWIWSSSISKLGPVLPQYTHHLHNCSWDKELANALASTFDKNIIIKLSNGSMIRSDTTHGLSFEINMMSRTSSSMGEYHNRIFDNSMEHKNLTRTVTGKFIDFSNLLKDVFPLETQNTILSILLQRGGPISDISKYKKLKKEIVSEVYGFETLYGLMSAINICVVFSKVNQSPIKIGSGSITCVVLMNEFSIHLYPSKRDIDLKQSITTKLVNLSKILSTHYKISHDHELSNGIWIKSKPPNERILKFWKGDVVSFANADEASKSIIKETIGYEADKETMDNLKNLSMFQIQHSKSQLDCFYKAHGLKIKKLAVKKIIESTSSYSVELEGDLYGKDSIDYLLIYNKDKKLYLRMKMRKNQDSVKLLLSTSSYDDLFTFVYSLFMSKQKGVYDDKAPNFLDKVKALHYYGLPNTITCYSDAIYWMIDKLEVHLKIYGTRQQVISSSEMNFKFKSEIMGGFTETYTVVETMAGKIFGVGQSNVNINFNTNDIKTSVDHNKIVDTSKKSIDRYLSKPRYNYEITEPETTLVDVVLFKTFTPTIELEGKLYRITGSLEVNGEVIQINKLATTDDLHKLPHDLCMSELIGSTDVTLKSINLTLGDHDDSKSPDYISVSSDESIKYINVVEVATTQERNLLSRSFTTKKHTYSDILKKRSSDKVKIRYDIICVSKDAIMTTVSGLTKREKERIVSLYQYGLTIKNLALSNKYIIELDSDITKRQTRILDIFSSIPEFDGDDLLPKEVVDACRSPITQDDMIRARLIIEAQWKIAINSTASDANDFKAKTNPSLNEYYLDYNRHLEKINDISNYASRVDKKSVIQIPYFLPDMEEYFDNDISALNLEGLEDNLMARVWSQAIDNVHKREGNTLTEIERINLNPVEQLHLSTEPKSNEKKYNGRTKVTLSEEDNIELAKIGVGGKKYQSNQEVIRYRKKKRLGFSTNCPVDDIEEFIENCNLLTHHSEREIKDESIISLIKKGYGIHDNEASVENVIRISKLFLQSKMGFLSSLISDIGQELAISLRQNVNDNEFRLKKLPHFKDVYILIKPTNASEKIFYSLLFKTEMATSKCESIKTVFKKVITLNEEWSTTEFVSTDQSKLVNLCRCESMMLANLIFACEFYYISIYNVKSLNSLNELEPKITKFLNFLFLVLVEDKHQTEELITKHRYIHMESMVRFPSFPKPSKMIDTFNIFMRSRLELFIYKRSIRLIKEYCENPVRYNKDKTEDRNWVGFKNPFVLDGMDLSSCDNDQWLNLCYVGYQKNKDEIPGANTSGKLLSKIIEKENELRRHPDGKIDYSYIGLKCPEESEMGVHEFDPSVLKYYCHKAKEKMKKIHGMNSDSYERYIQRQISKKLSGESIESIATLKASSTFSKEFFKYRDYRDKEKITKRLLNKSKRDMQCESLNDLKENIKKSEDISETNRALIVELIHSIESQEESHSYHRVKMIEFLLNHIEEKEPGSTLECVMDLVIDCLKELEDEGCLLIDIFQKNQHAGLREIYVLVGYARILQKTVEDIAKVLCSEFKGETMTNPKSKYKIPESTHFESNCNYNGKYFYYATSDDATKWNQCHIVTKFIMMFCQLLPKIFHNFLFRVLRFWLNKKIKLQDTLLEQFEVNNVDTLSYDVWVNRAYKAFKGLSKEIWMNEGDSYITTSSGFMQGILHYTSSLLHVITLDLYNDIIKKKLNSVFFEKLEEHAHNESIDLKQKDYRRSQILSYYLVSSDDSSSIIHFPLEPVYQDENHIRTCAFMASTCFKFKTNMGKFFSIHRAVKSTSNTCNVAEFNSEFYFFKDQHKPTYRWVNAALNITEQDNLVGRQEEMSSGLSNVLEGGGTILMNSVIQISQALLYYRLLGSSCNSMWLIYSEFIMRDKDPSCGFFLMDQAICSGIPGTRYNLWKMSSTFNQSSKLKLLLESTLENRSIDSINESMNPGTFERSLYVSYKKNQAYNRMLKRVNFTPDELLSLEEDPSILFKRATTSADLRLKLLIKLRSPGVSNSLSKNNALSRELASAVYILSRPVFKTSLIEIKEMMYDINDLNERGLDIRDAKVNLLGYLTIMRKKIEIEQRREIILNKRNRIEHIPMKQYQKCDDYESIEEAIEYGFDINKELIHFINTKHRSDIKKNLELDNEQFLDILSSTFKSVAIGTVKVQLENEKDDNNIMVEVHRESRMNDDNVFYLVVRQYNSFKIIKRAYNDVSEYKKSVLSEDEELFLFPMKRDYEEFYQNVRSMTIGRSLEVAKNKRRRTRLEYLVMGNERQSISSMMNVVKWKWFNISTIDLSYNLLDSLFNELQLTISWIRPTWKETLEVSPFENILQLFWFLSSSGSKPRKIRLNGSYIRNEKLDIVSIITRNFSNGMKRISIHREQNDSASDLLKLKHVISGINTLPLKDERAIRILSSVMSSVKDIARFQPHEFDKIMSKLSVIQELTKTCPFLCLGEHVEYDRHNFIRNLVKILDNCPEYKKLLIYAQEICGSPEFSELDISYERGFSDDPHQNLLHALVRCIINKSDPIQMKNLYAEEFVDILSKQNWFNCNKDKMAMIWCMDGKLITDQDYKDMSDRFLMNFQNNMVPLLIRNNLGTFGYYSEKQKYDKTKKFYYGDGQWRGYMGGTLVVIDIFRDSDSGSNIICGMTISQTSNLSEMISSLKQWCLDNNVEGSGRYSIDKKFYRNCAMCIFNFIQIESHKYKGIPVRVEEMSEGDKFFKFKDLYLEKSHTGMRLTTVSKGDDGSPDKFITILSVPISENWFNKNITISQSYCPAITRLLKGIADYINYQRTKDTDKIIIAYERDLLPRELFDPIKTNDWIKRLMLYTFEMTVFDQRPMNEEEEEDLVEHKIDLNTPWTIETLDKIFDNLCLDMNTDPMDEGDILKYLDMEEENLKYESESQNISRKLRVLDHPILSKISMDVREKVTNFLMHVNNLKSMRNEIDIKSITIPVDKEIYDYKRCFSAYCDLDVNQLVEKKDEGSLVEGMDYTGM